ncbi:MAG: hypothetical protein II180_13395 [Proteobacteria bacterium]|nr:hypothetical protein [Pseudomonadota bacterium]
MKRAFFLISLSACLMSCASTSGFDDPDVQMRECLDGAEIYYCSMTTRCGHGFCLEDTVDHCGDALIKCKGNAICEEGLCVCESFSLIGNRTKEICSATCCPSGCVDVQSDPHNCGECGHSCEDGQICVAGQCSGECPSYMKSCPPDRCVDIKTDPNNCGGCGIVCPRGAELLHYEISQCDNGQCVPICDSAWNDADHNILNGCEASPYGICGNGIVEPGEKCDGTKLNDQTCATQVGEGSKGTLRCSADCLSFVTTGCTSPNLCGNGRIDSNETCDGAQLAGATCESFVGKGSAGVVKCNAQCNGYDLSACTKPETCGNGYRDAHEVCDGQLSAAITCEKIVGKGSTGRIKCAANCAGYDISECTAAAECGNLRRETAEACDGGDFGGATCATSVGAGSMGTLICTPQCEIDTSRCSKPSTCGNNRADGNDVCDGADLKGKSCASVVGPGSTGSLKCRDNCSGYDISGCSKPATCDGNQIDQGEICDGLHLNDKTCASVVGLGSTGTLKCKSNCAGYETTSCTQPTACGNGKIDSGETCDGTNVGGRTCAQLVGEGSVGTPRCSSDCRSHDLSGCSAPKHCGNGVLDTALGEVCDGSNLNGKSCATEAGQGSTGSLKCSNDCFYFDMSGCKSPARCGDGIIQNDEKCDMTNLAKRTCESELGPGAIGTLRCNATCNGFDTSGCIVNTCGNGSLEKSETCDGALLNGWTCDKQVGTGSTGTPKCNATCSGYENGSCTPASTCGNGKLNPGEDCDNTSFRNNITNCKTYNSTLYASGKLACTNTCTIDTSGCVKAATAKCGNNTIEAGEICDGTNFGGKSCVSELGIQSASGILQCTNDCKTIDTSYCEFCGDKKLQANEECDGSSWRYNSCVAYNPQLYSGGTLSCNSATCKLNTTACTLKNVNVECEGDEVRCTGTSPIRLQACLDGAWETMEECAGQLPICSENNVSCIPTPWCNVQKIGIENGKWKGYSRILLPASVPEPEIYLACTQNINLPLEYWANNFMILTEKNTQCHDCGNNIEFMTSEDFDFYAGTWYCTFIAQFQINNITRDFACLPIQNGASEPIQVTSTTTMTPQTTWIVNN